jgi:hypothetical protein
MPQDRSFGRKRGAGMRAHGPLRATAGAAILSLITAVTTPAAMAQTSGSDNEGVWNKFMKSVGASTAPDPNSDISYIERPPLVVPPSHDLPPPVADPAAPATNWPTSNPKTVKHAKSKTEVIPDTAVQNPNPPFEKKPWYNPAGWFSKEEYGTFAGEPVRQNLTEPPAGYRVPSAEQPYGISPDKKTKITGQSPMTNPVTQNQQPAGTQPGR